MNTISERITRLPAIFRNLNTIKISASLRMPVSILATSRSLIRAEYKRPKEIIRNSIVFNDDTERNKLQGKPDVRNQCLWNVKCKSLQVSSRPSRRIWTATSHRQICVYLPGHAVSLFLFLSLFFSCTFHFFFQKRARTPELTRCGFPDLRMPRDLRYPPP